MNMNKKIYIAMYFVAVILLIVFNNDLKSIKNKEFNETIIFEDSELVSVASGRSFSHVYEIKSADGRVFIVSRLSSMLIDEFEKEVKSGDELDIRFEKRYPFSNNKYVVHELKKGYKCYYYDDEVRTIGQDIFLIICIVFSIMPIIYLICKIIRKR